MDLGAAWLWDYNPKIKQLLTDNIPVFRKQGKWVEGLVSITPNADFEMMQLPPQLN
jgi:hypothetical protein